ncbi:hypothetical protein BB559_006838, partial [Furculomyces boomerangus]
NYKYMHGFGNEFESEALEGALPIGRNTPRFAPYGLHIEQLNGTAFTVPRSAGNRRTWFYRIRPSVMHLPFEKYLSKNSSGGPNRLVTNFNDPNQLEVVPNQLKWTPFKIPKKSDGLEIDFVDGMSTICGAGDPALGAGIAIHIYCANSDMKGRAFTNSDGDYLIVPQKGALRIQTEFGYMLVQPNEICVIQRGMRFRVEYVENPENKEKSQQGEGFRGYILEVFGGHFEIPDLGPIGANGLANPRDFKIPTAHYEDSKDCKDMVDGQYEIIQKFSGELFSAKQSFSPFDVVAWHGNYTPYKYNLANFCPMGSTSFDHVDPSIYTVLTCKSHKIGTAVADFVAFPPRHITMDDTFLIPYSHRNCMSEFVGLIYGEPNEEKGEFMPGSASLHSPMISHGSDARSIMYEYTREETPLRIGDNTMHIMFESMYTLKTTKWVMQECDKIEHYYLKDWKNIPIYFDPTNRD